MELSRYATKVIFLLKKGWKAFLNYVLEFMLTLAEMQNNSTLMWRKFEIKGFSILKVIQALNTVHIGLHIGRSGPVIGSPVIGSPTAMEGESRQ